MKDDLMVVSGDVRWTRDPNLGLRPSLLSESDWRQVVELGYRDNPEVVLTTSYPEPDDEPLEIAPEKNDQAKLAQIAYIGALLERRMKFDEECRANPELSAIALKSRKLSPSALTNYINHLTKLMHSYGEAGAELLGQINQRALRRRRQGVKR